MKPSSVKFTDFVTTLRDPYELKPIVIAKRFHFHKREQLEGEGVAAYSAALKKCSEHCAFGAFLEEALRKPIHMWPEMQTNSEKTLSRKKSPVENNGRNGVGNGSC